MVTVTLKRDYVTLDNGTIATPSAAGPSKD
jgi:hypothetical protein